MKLPGAVGFVFLLNLGRAPSGDGLSLRPEEEKFLFELRSADAGISGETECFAGEVKGEVEEENFASRE